MLNSLKEIVLEKVRQYRFTLHMLKHVMQRVHSLIELSNGLHVSAQCTNLLRVGPTSYLARG